jgi:hypothetical protein
VLEIFLKIQDNLGDIFMADSWDGFLDIIGLDTDIIPKAKLKILMNFPSEYSDKSLLLSLFERIEEIYGQKKFTIL